MRRGCQILTALVMLSALCQACSLASGYFHQVTEIRGRVVGSSWVPFRWLRRSLSVSEATLTLYEFRSPAKIGDLKIVAVTKPDSHGNFDFGSIPKGHYHLVIEVKDSDRMGGFFDVEVTDAVKSTRTITVDVSPIHPDCTGGNEFIETKS